MVRLRIDAERRENPRVHIVKADQYAQLDDLPFVEMRPQSFEHGVRHRDITGHGVGVGECCALTGAERLGILPIGERVAFLVGESFRG